MATEFPGYPILRATGRRISGRTEYQVMRRHMVKLPGFDPILIPAGFRSDLASIPTQLAWWLPHDHPALIAAAVPHDWLYRTGESPKWSRWACDAVFREILHASEISWAVAWLCWATVRLFGRRHYLEMRGALRLSRLWAVDRHSKGKI